MNETRNTMTYVYKIMRIIIVALMIIFGLSIILWMGLALVGHGSRMF